MTSAMVTDRLQPLLQTAEALTASTLAAHGLPPSLAPAAPAALGGIGLLTVWLGLTAASASFGGTASPARQPSRGVAVSGGRGVTTPSPVGGARDDRGPGPTPRGVGGGAGRMEEEADDWASEETAVVEQAGAKEPPPRGWLVPDLVPHGPVPVWRWHWRRPTRQKPLIDREVKGYVTAVLGSGGTGKSYVLVDLGIAALTGGTWLGKPVQRVKRVLYVDCELDGQTFWTRAYAVARGRWLEDGKPPKGLHYLRLKASLASWAGQQQIQQAVRKSKADLILVDSLTIGAYGLALADQNGWRRVYAGFERWGKPVVAIDHLGKEAGKGAVGSFMKQAMVRSALTMERERGGNIKVEHSKTNFGPQVETFRVVSSFEGGKDGVPLTVSFTAVVDPANSTPPPTLPAPQQARTPPAPRPPAPLRASPTPLALPVLTPPGDHPLSGGGPDDQGADTTASPILAWLALPSNTTEAIPSRVIYAAMAQKGVTLRACKMQLKALTEQGQLERTGSAQKGYLYALAGRQPPEEPCQAAG